MSALVPVKGPLGVYYVRADTVAVIGPPTVEPHLMRDLRTRSVRLVSTFGGASFTMFDTPDNMDTLLPESAR